MWVNCPSSSVPGGAVPEQRWLVWPPRALSSSDFTDQAWEDVRIPSEHPFLLPARA